MNKQTFVVALFTLLLLINSTSFASEPHNFSGILASHNEVRSKFQQQPLSWSDSLANYAQQWVNHLAKTHNCEMIHRPNTGGGEFQQQHGENLFWGGAIQYSDGTKKAQTLSPREVVKAWAEEENYYNYQTNKCQAGQVCGHFTQMVWHESRQVGCAKVSCSDKSQLWACNYHPRGNYIGEWPF